jgi:hypothetical protein
VLKESKSTIKARGKIAGSLAILAVGLLAPQIGQAQGSITFLSNLEQTSAGGDQVGSDSWLAAAFQTGINAAGYELNSIQLAMTDASGAPGGITVKLYANISPPIALSPGASLGVLSGLSDPTTAGTYTYAPVSSLTLSPNSYYFIVLTAGTTVANGAYDWSHAGANNYNPNGGWRSFAGGWTSANGTSWNASTAVFSQFAINATPAPEPGVMGLFALGGLLVAFQRRKARS